jgi:hypothetical protein
VEQESEDKPILDLAVPNEQGQDPEIHPQELEEEDVKERRPSEIDDDDEPPPPYSENDPIEDGKSEIEGGGGLG